MSIRTTGATIRSVYKYKVVKGMDIRIIKGNYTQSDNLSYITYDLNIEYNDITTIMEIVSKN